MLRAAQGVLAGQLGFVRQAYAQSVAALNPVAYWHLGEAGGPIIIDERAVQHGSYVGPVEFGVEGIVADSAGTAVAFNGVDAFGLIPHNPAFATAAGTVSFAMQMDTVDGQHLLLAKDLLGQPGGLTVDVKDGRLRAYLRDESGAAHWVPNSAGAADIEVGTAHQVALTWGNRGAELWLDGERVAHIATLQTGLVGNATPLLLAAYPGPVALGDAVMDEVAWFASQLSDAQIGTLSRAKSIERIAAAPWGVYVTGQAAFARNPPAKPGYRQPLIDADFGTRIIRVGLGAGQPVPNIGGTAPSWHRHSYSNKRQWNANESLLALWFLQSGSNGFQGFYIMDGHTYEFKPWGRRKATTTVNQWIWHPKDPARMIFVSSNQLRFYLPETDTEEVVATFSGESGLIITSTGDCSDADGVAHPRVFLRRGAGSGAAGFVYDIQTDTKFPTFTGTRADWSGMDHTGDFVISSSGDSHSAHDVNGNLVGSNSDGFKHVDLVWNAGRTQQWAYGTWRGSPFGAVGRARFPQFDQVQAVTDGAHGDCEHFSGRHIAPGNPFEGWAFMWASRTSAPAGVWHQEALAIRVSDHQVRRLGHIYTDRDGGDDYPHEAHLTPSPSGTRMIFASRWGAPGPTSDVQSYMIETFDYLTPWPR